MQTLKPHVAHISISWLHTLCCSWAQWTRRPAETESQSSVFQIQIHSLIVGENIIYSDKRFLRSVQLLHHLARSLRLLQFRFVVMKHLHEQMQPNVYPSPCRVSAPRVSFSVIYLFILPQSQKHQGGRVVSSVAKCVPAPRNLLLWVQTWKSGNSVNIQVCWKSVDFFIQILHSHLNLDVSSDMFTAWGSCITSKEIHTLPIRFCYLRAVFTLVFSAQELTIISIQAILTKLNFWVLSSRHVKTLQI